MKYTGEELYKKCIIHVLATVLLMPVLMSNSAFAASDNKNVHFYGALVAEPCVIPPGDENITLDFGTVIDKYLYLNTRTLGQNFEIRLAECDLSLGKTVKMTFTGTENNSLPGLLAVDGSSVASGIAIGLETQDARPLPLNKETQEYELQSGNNIISLKAYVQGEPQALASKTIKYGTFIATSTFTLEYE
ncbi:fimbrial protein [Serratia fonticola]|uniref:fimbrial protein n=1 Tax=Serratia fonticola TaxID=47917 RepID=UPI0016441F2A|nr:type 1 fimbrial protein [Serratia fonticola]